MTDTNHQHPTQHFSDETARELMAARVEFLEKQMEQIQRERDKALIWGIRTLGGMLLALSAWAYSAGIFGKHSS